jgi:predicted aspartyl protease
MASPWSFGPEAPDAISRQTRLTIEGYVLDVIIHQMPGSPVEADSVQFFESGGLIDTGASDVCIDYRLARALKLRQIDQRTVATPGGSLLAAIHLGVVEIPALNFKQPMPLFALKVAAASYSVILGRSFLRQFIVTFDGPNGHFHFATPIAPTMNEPFDE